MANTILTIIWHLGKHGTTYRELGSEYFDRLKGNQAQRYHVRKLQKMGFNVTLERATRGGLTERDFRKRVYPSRIRF